MLAWLGDRVAAHEALSESDAYHAQELPRAQAVRAAVAELIEADREVDAIEDEVRRAYFAGPRPHSYGTGWEVRDAAAQKDRERRREAAHARRARALAAMGDTP